MRILRQLFSLLALLSPSTSHQVIEKKILTICFYQNNAVRRSWLFYNTKYYYVSFFFYSIKIGNMCYFFEAFLFDVRDSSLLYSTLGAHIPEWTRTICAGAFANRQDIPNVSSMNSEQAQLPTRLRVTDRL